VIILYLYAPGTRYPGTHGYSGDMGTWGYGYAGTWVRGYKEEVSGDDTHADNPTIYTTRTGRLRILNPGCDITYEAY
jgi:hypothetical protein